MCFKKLLGLGILLSSLSAQAIPPAPPSAFYNKIRTIAGRNCVLENDMPVNELKDTDSVKFVLQLNKAATAGTLTLMEDGKAVESFKVTCK